VDKGVDTVDNQNVMRFGRSNRPPTDAERPPTAEGPISAVPNPVEADGPRGSDIAREALRAAQEAAAARPAASKGGQPRGALRARRRRWSGPGPDDRDPQPLGRLVSRMAIDRGWSGRLTDAAVIGRWPQLVGPEIADHCAPVSLRDGELLLQAESTAWATQLRMLQRQILARLADAVGRDVVRRLRVVGPSGRPSWRHGPRHVRGRGPRDTYG
jgi:predicted nucleic acid-binding Zn ribbon protein